MQAAPDLPQLEHGFSLSHLTLRLAQATHDGERSDITISCRIFTTGLKIRHNCMALMLHEMTSVET